MKMNSVRQTVQQGLMKQSAEAKATNSHPSPYANDPRNITSKNYQKIVPVSDSVKQELMELVKDSFTNSGGMLGSNSKYSDIINDYLATISPEDRSSAGFTLSEMFTNEARSIASFIKDNDPKWDFGQSVNPEILEEAFRPKLDMKV